jgi:hypothetical protein
MVAAFIMSRRRRPPEWSQRIGTEDPDRVEAIYSWDLSGTDRRIDVVWHDGQADRWQWILFERGEPIAVSEDLFSSAEDAQRSAMDVARRIGWT